MSDERVTMGFADRLLGKSRHDNWTVAYRGILTEVTYSDIVMQLGRPTKGAGGYVFWRMPLSQVDPGLSEDESIELSNRDWRPFAQGAGKKTPSLDGERWFVLATSARAIGELADELNAMCRDITPV